MHEHAHGTQVLLKVDTNPYFLFHELCVTFFITLRNRTVTHQCRLLQSVFGWIMEVVHTC